MKACKRYAAAAEKVDRLKAYDFETAVSILKETAGAKFDETVECAVKLGVDPRKSDQIVRGATVLPHGLGKTENPRFC
jgi:large subunit ribosomal protein L1